MIASPLATNQSPVGAGRGRDGRTDEAGTSSPAPQRMRANSAKTRMVAVLSRSTPANECPSRERFTPATALRQNVAELSATAGTWLLYNSLGVPAGMLQSVGLWKPPAPEPRERPLGVVSLLRALATNPLEAWTAAHFELPVVSGGLPFARVVVVSEPSAIRRVLLENARQLRKRLDAEAHPLRRARRRFVEREGQALAHPAPRAGAFVRPPAASNSFAPDMMAAAEAMIARLRSQCGDVVDVMAEVTRLTLSVLERTIFSDGIGADREDVRIAMQRYFEVASRVDPFDILNLPDFVPRPTRLPVRASLRFFEQTIDALIAARRKRRADNPERAATRSAHAAPGRARSGNRRGPDRSGSARERADLHRRRP